MAKSTAVSEAQARELKDKLERRGFAVTESKTAGGYPKLSLNTDEASITIEQEDAVSKDVFGNDLLAFTPHKLTFASRADAVDAIAAAKISVEIFKVGMKTIVKTHATDLAAAEATAGEAIEYSDRWKTKGI